MEEENPLVENFPQGGFHKKDDEKMAEGKPLWKIFHKGFPPLVRKQLPHKTLPPIHLY